MTSKEFDLLIAMILEMLKNGQVDRVIALLEEARSKNDDGQKK
jgi:hypothetical protein